MVITSVINACSVDLIYDVPYPLSKGNDVGGRTLLGLGAKGNRIIVFNSGDMKQVIKELWEDTAHITISDDLRKQLIDKAYAFYRLIHLSIITNE